MSADPLHDRDHYEDEQDEAPDERWLVSYADMMTLLFGLFVMLYAMGSPKKQLSDDDAKKLSESLRNKFGAPTAVAAPVPGVAVNSPPSTMTTRNEVGDKGETPGERPGKIPVVADEPVDGKDPNATTKARLQDPGQTTEGPDFEEELGAARTRIKQLGRELARAVATNDKQKATIDESGKKIAEFEALLNSLKEEISRKNAGPLPGDGENKRSFISAIIQWETEKHDVDMTILHPSGKVYSFKNRKIEGLSGNFILDSRQGPGMEVWQDAMLVPGRYEIRAKLYNDYGNKKPAVVKGSILTVKGRVDLPEISLTMKRRDSTYVFTVDPEGGVKLETK